MLGSTERVPFLFDHYVVGQVLGRGAMGVVYLATDIRSDRHVALKTLHRRGHLDDPVADRDFMDRFRREAELCETLVHPNIVRLYDVGYETGGISFLAMEYVSGESLLSLIRRLGVIPIEAVLRIIGDILEGLAYAHERGIIHRDIKPANILVTLEGVAKIADFGVARSLRTNATALTQAGQLLGTPHYMSPELVSGREIDGRADLFSVGVTMFEMLSGKRPFDRPKLLDVLFDVVNTPAPPLTSREAIPEWCVLFNERLLAKEPTDRFLSAIDALTQLRVLDPGLRQGAATEYVPSMVLTIHQELSPEETPTIPLLIRPVAANEPSPDQLDGSELATDPRGTQSSRVAGTSKWNLQWTPFRIVIALSVAIVVLLTAGWLIRRSPDREKVPVSLISPAELRTRRSILSEGNRLFALGRYAESAATYESYLKRSPGAPAALKGRQRAIDAQRAYEKQQALLLERLQQERTAAALRKDALAKQKARTLPQTRRPLSTSTTTKPAVGQAEKNKVVPAEKKEPTETEEKRSLWKRLRESMRRSNPRNR